MADGTREVQRSLPRDPSRPTPLTGEPPAALNGGMDTRERPRDPKGTTDHEGAGVHMAHSPVRCPYCHDACGPEDARAMVCQQCLSRHHGACWREGGGRCASCGSTRALAPATPEVRLAPAELELVRRGLPREAVDRVVRRLGVSEADATAALLEAASQALARASREPGASHVAVKIVAIVAAMIVLLAIVA